MDHAHGTPDYLINLCNSITLVVCGPTLLETLPG